MAAIGDTNDTDETTPTVELLREYLATYLADDMNLKVAGIGSPEQFAECKTLVMQVFDSAATGADSVNSLRRALMGRACDHGIDPLLLKSMCSDVAKMAVALPLWIVSADLHKRAAARFLEVLDAADAKAA